MKEQRTRERFEMNIPADVMVSTSHDNEELLKLNTVNICSGGAYLITDKKIPEGASVKLDLFLIISSRFRSSFA